MSILSVLYLAHLCFASINALSRNDEYESGTLCTGDVITREEERVCSVCGERETPTTETGVGIIITAQFQQMCLENTQLSHCLK